MLDPRPSYPLTGRQLLTAMTVVFLVTMLLVMLSGCTMTAGRIAYGVGAGADLVTTSVALQRGATELNPLISWAGDAWLAPALVLKGLIPLICEMAPKSQEKSAVAVYWLGGIVGAAAGIWNMTQINKLDDKTLWAGQAINKTPVPQVRMRLAF